MKVYNSTIKSGGSFLDKLINKLPFELHVPGYEFCGPGTKLDKRIERGDKGINKLDSACKVHDIAYATHKSGIERRKADRDLSEVAFHRFKASDATVGERATALAVSGIMKAKSTLGFGLSKPRQNDSKLRSKSKNKSKKNALDKKKNLLLTKKVLTKAIDQAKNQIFKTPSKSLSAASRTALRAAAAVVRKHKTPKKTFTEHTPRIIPVPKIGGLIPLVPIFAGLSALGSLVGGATSIAKAVRLTHDAKESLAEQTRHNKNMETIALGKTKNGNGLYLKPYRAGLGLYVKPYIERELTVSSFNEKN